jgi:hypothetical protein
MLKMSVIYGFGAHKYLALHVCPGAGGICSADLTSVGLHNQGGRKGTFPLLYLLACAFQY